MKTRPFDPRFPEFPEFTYDDEKYRPRGYIGYIGVKLEPTWVDYQKLPDGPRGDDLLYNYYWVKTCYNCVTTNPEGCTHIPRGH